MNRTDSATDDDPVSVVLLRDDGGPRDEDLSDHLRDPGPGEWACRVTWQIGPDQWTARRVELVAPDGGMITPTRWRWVRLAEVIGHARRQVEVLASLGALSADTRPTALEALRSVSKGEDRSGYPPEHFEAVAESYNRAVTLGDKFPTRATRRAMTDALGWAPSDATVRGWVAMCKRRGLITKTARPSRSGTRRTEQ